MPEIESLHTAELQQLSVPDADEAVVAIQPGDRIQQLGSMVAASEANPTRSEVGLLTAPEYAVRRSETLNEDPEAELDERWEIRSYFERQNPDYVDQIHRLADFEHPMHPDCRVVVTIPAYNESSRIRQTLEQYTHQDIDSSLFEIVVFATPVENDSTLAEVEGFKFEHPEISVVFVSKPWAESEPATVGNARKYAADIAMSRMTQRGSIEHDTVLITNDADTLHIDEDYLSSILSEFDTNKTEEALVTELDIPLEVIKKPNIAAAFYLLSQFEEIYATGDLGDGQEPIPEPALTNGRSTAIRTAAYAAVGGHNPHAVVSEDWELGWMLADARGWDANRIGFLKGTKLITDPRRFIDTVINRVPTDQQLIGFKDSPELRQLNNDEALALVPDSFDWELFQDDADSVWCSRLTGANKRIPKGRFEAIFDATMRRLGVEYVVDDSGHVVLTNVDGFLEQIKGTVDEIQIVHSKPRVYTPEMLQRIEKYFSDIPVGVIGSRQLYADKIVVKIQSAQANGEDTSTLQKELSRFQ